MWTHRSAYNTNQSPTQTSFFHIFCIFWLNCRSKANSMSLPGRKCQSHRPMHTHWTRHIPSGWILCSWLLAVCSACVCSTAKQVDLLFCFNLCTCMFSLQARRALIRRGRKAGKRRLKGPRRRKQSTCTNAKVMVCMLALFPITVGSIDAARHVHQSVGKGTATTWALGRKARNRLMHAMHGNTSSTPLDWSEFMQDAALQEAILIGRRSCWPKHCRTISP